MNPTEQKAFDQMREMNPHGITQEHIDTFLLSITDLGPATQIAAMMIVDIARAALTAAKEVQAQVEPPNGATHYQPHQKTYYKRVSATEWYLWSCTGKGWLESKGTGDSSDWIYLHPVQQPTPQAQRLSGVEINETYRQQRITFSVPDDCDRYPSTWINTDSLDKLCRAIETAFAVKNGIHLGDCAYQS